MVVAEATKPFRSVFEGRGDTFVTYPVTIQIEDKLLGGVPKDPKIIESWLLANVPMMPELKRLDQQALLVDTLREMGADVPEGADIETMLGAASNVANIKQTQGFKRDEDGLYIESRQIKAMLKENANIVYAGDKWGVTRKGPKNYVAERVFVKPDRVHLGRMEADSVHTSIIHAQTPQGKRTALAYHEAAEEPTLEFELLVLLDHKAHDPTVKPEWLDNIWKSAEKNGLGASRSQGFGQFVVTSWAGVTAPSR
mgnify:CR=1 FL=1